MSKSVAVIYDDRRVPPPDIDAIIGATRFSDILRKRVSLGEQVRRSAVDGGATDLFHLVDERDARYLADLIETNHGNRMFLRLPSCLMPTLDKELAAAIEKGRYALESILLAPPAQDEAAALLTPDDAISLLHAEDPVEIRDFIVGLAASNSMMVDRCYFVDLRRPDAFLQFMGDATEARHFNATARAGRKFRKASRDRQKMAGEYSFFHIVPETMKCFLIPTFEFTDDGESAGYAMEHINVPDAALQFVHSAFDENSFATLVDSFFEFVRVRPTRDVGVSGARDCAVRDILGKMDRRVQECLGTRAGQQLNRVLQAAGPLGGLRAMQDRAGAIIREAIACDDTHTLAVGHGDPCFSNILFDRRTGLFRLIDPRGATALDDAWMHPLYDVAKFTHSAIGGYDFVNNELFECVLNEDLRLQLTLSGGGPPGWCREIVERRVVAEGLSLFVLRAYELSLFMSMLPLHSDHPRKLSGFAMIACRLIETLEDWR